MITIFIGKSASGKDFFLKHAVKKGAKPVVSFTTRPKRDGETEGVDYHFVTQAEFMALNDNGQIAEYRCYDTLFQGKPEKWYYGSPMLDPDAEDYVVILDIDGAKSYIDRYGADALDIIYIDVPDEIRKKRAMSRGSFDQTEWDRRAADDAVKFSSDAIDALSQVYGKPVRIISNAEDGNAPYAYKVKLHDETGNTYEIQAGTLFQLVILRYRAQIDRRTGMSNQETL